MFRCCFHDIFKTNDFRITFQWGANFRRAQTSSTERVSTYLHMYDYVRTSIPLLNALNFMVNKVRLQQPMTVMVASNHDICFFFLSFLFAMAWPGLSNQQYNMDGIPD